MAVSKIKVARVQLDLTQQQLAEKEIGRASCRERV